MSEISSTIRIEDGFTEPLIDLSKEAMRASDRIEDLSEAFSELTESIEGAEVENYAWIASMKPTDDLLKAIGKTYGNVSKTIKFESLAVRSILENKAEAVVKAAKYEISGIRTAGILFKNLYGQQIKFQTEGLKTFALLTKKYGKDIVKEKLVDLRKEAAFAAERLKLLKGNLPFMIKEAQTAIYNDKIKLKHKLSAIQKTIKAETEGFKTSALLAKHYSGKMIKESGAWKFAQSEIAGYKTYRNKLLELAKAPPPQNAANKIGNAGHAFGRWLDNHGMSGISKKVHFASGSMIKKFGAVASPVEDPSVFKYTIQRIKHYGTELGKVTKNGVKKGISWLSSSEGGKIVKDFAKDFGKMFGAAIIMNLSFSLFNKIKEKMISLVRSADAAIQNSLDELNLSDKFNSMYGEAGNAAKKRAYALANELGESASMVGELSAKAAYQGIGTDTFERIMRLSDKVGKLQLGETTEGAASTLISNIKSGHDAGTVAQMFGGGQNMERKLIRAGYERALNNGDLQKALDIAEQIAEQAGLTDEKYKKANNTLSQNYKKIHNTIDNVKRRLAETYTQALAPAVEKVKNFVESETFQHLINFIEKGVKFIGEKVSSIISSFIDNIHLIGGLLAAGVVAKLYLSFRNVQYIVGMLPFIRSALVWISSTLGLKGIAGALKVMTREQLILTARTKALAALKIAGPWLGIGAAIAGAMYGLYKLEGSTKSFSGYVKGRLAAGYQFAVNCVENLIRYTVRKFEGLNILRLKIEAGVYGIIGTIKSKVGELINWMIQKLLNFVTENPVLRKILEAMDVDVSKASSAVSAQVSNWTGGFGADEFSAADELIKKIVELESDRTELIDFFQGTEEAFESEGATVIAHLKTLVGLNKEQVASAKGIDDNTGEIRRQGEQEEELAWLKAFSDRQIMGAYGMMTSNNSRVINLNGVSEQTKAESLRRDRMTIPSRNRKYKI